MHHMELGGNVFCSGVEDETSVAGKFWGYLNKDSMMRARLPLGELLPILQYWVQDIDRAPPNMLRLENRGIELSSTEDLKG